LKSSIIFYLQSKSINCWFIYISLSIFWSSFFISKYLY